MPSQSEVNPGGWAEHHLTRHDVGDRACAGNCNVIATFETKGQEGAWLSSGGTNGIVDATAIAIVVSCHKGDVHVVGILSNE
ncbi:hypothetical protein GOP47_0010144 [Adiantum capillus-veneris]|uniref:Uncharacterized protein n=1 Tax=Adiantum capillus-veneris TaxID=13818 RepID=A0A9D4ZG23_ADICA|nr:hypothetical protein GOP47_0010144 [Adiantum capillus-veneris]